jgi:hypothetical protein
VVHVGSTQGEFHSVGEYGKDNQVVGSTKGEFRSGGEYGKDDQMVGSAKGEREGALNSQRTRISTCVCLLIAVLHARSRPRHECHDYCGVRIHKSV